MGQAARLLPPALLLLTLFPGPASAVLPSPCPLPAPTPQPDLCVKSFRCVGAAGEWMEVFMPAGSVCHADSCPGQCNASGDCVAAPCPPATPGSLLATSGAMAESYVLSWTSAQRATRYELIESYLAAGTSSTVYSGSALQVTFTSKPPSEYRYTVRACNSAGCSVNNPTASLFVFNSPSTITLPTQATTGSYTLSWSAVAGAAYYQILEPGKPLLATAGTAQAFTNRIDGTYRYRIRACSPIVCGPYSAEYSVRVFRTPPAPVPLAASVSTTATGHYALSWKYPAGYIVDGYLLERRFETGPWASINLGVAEGYVETQFTNGVYSYRVSAFNSAGTSPAAGPVSVTVAIPAPPSSDPGIPPNPNPSVPDQQWVGVLKGSPSVEGGAAVYGVPIEVPPGRGGVQPSVELSYSSRSGNGVAGVGWSVSGSSSIYRCPTMMARDGLNGPVLHQISDKLCFDGQQLMRSGGQNYGKQGSEYHTEIDTFARVIQGGGDIQSWSAYFRVEHKSGHVGIYQALRSDKANVIPDTWRLVREFDTHGNCLDYRFVRFSTGLNGGEEWVVDRIAYTGMRSAAPSAARVGDTETCVVSDPARAIAFEYAVRPDIRTTFDTGAANPASARLSAITTWVGAAAVRRYELGYDPSAATKRSLLTSIKTCAGATCGAAQLPPTRFAYQQDVAQFSWHRPLDTDGNKMGTDWQNFLAADFDGDGTRDIEFRHLESGSWTREIRLTSCNKRVAFGDITADWNLLQSADLNNDGRAELVGVRAGRLVMVQLSCSSAPAYFDTGIATSSVPWPKDYDGDGRVDLAFSTIDTGGTFHTRICFRNLGTALSWNCSAGVELPQNPSSIEQKVMERDFNGDGRVDVLFDRTILTSGSASIAISTSPLTWTRYSLASLGGPSTLNVGTAAKYLWVDINGDSLPDIYLPGNQVGEPGTVWINRGGTAGPGMFQQRAVATLGVDVRRLQFARAIDVDADGLDEILIPSYRTIPFCGGPDVATCPGTGAPKCPPGEPCQLPQFVPAPTTSQSTMAASATDPLKAWCGDEFDTVPGALVGYDHSVFHWTGYRLRETFSGGYAVEAFDPQLEAPINYPFTTEEDFFGDGLLDVSFRFVDSWGTCSNGTRIKLGYYADDGATLRGPIIARNKTRAPDLLVRVNSGVTNATTSASLGASAAWSYYPLSADGFWSYVRDDHPNTCPVTGTPFYSASPAPPPSGYAYFTSSMWTVAQFDISNGSPNGPELNTTCYRYQDAMLSMEGRGFQGFKSISVEEWLAPAEGEIPLPSSSAQTGPCGQSSLCSANNKISTTTFFQTFPLSGRQASALVTLASDPSKIVSRETLAWQTQDTSWSGKVVAPLRHTTYRFDLEPNPLTTQFTITDGFDGTSGEVTHSCSILQHSSAALASVHTGTTLQDSIKTESRELESLTSTWWLGRLKAVTTVADFLPAGTAVSETTCPAVSASSEAKSARIEYTWYPDGQVGHERSLATERLVVKGVEESSSDYREYDSFGNLKRKDVTARNVTGPLTTLLGYSSPGSYFQETETNPAHHTATATFDPGTGAPLTKQEVQGGPVTRFAYDVLGRLLSTTADGFPPVHQRLAGCPDCGEIVLSRQTIQAGAPTKIEFLDRLGRVVQTQTTAFDGRPIVSAVDYNDRGAKVAEYPPYECPSTGCPADTGAFSPFPILYSNLDPLGRVGRKAALRNAALIAAGKGAPTLVTDYFSTGLNTVITVQNPFGQALSMSRAYDGRGELVETMQQVTDATGKHEIVMRYRYDPAGNVTHIVKTKPNDLAIIYDLAATYDDLGRKVRVDDPDRGTWTYSWDGLGRLAAQKDAKGTQLTFGYDSIGRMTSRSVITPGETARRLEATWGYDENGFAGLATSVVGRDIRASVPATPGVDTVPTIDQYKREFHYDAVRRQDRVTTHILRDPSGVDAPRRVLTMAVDYGYDAAFGWLKTVRYPTGDGIYLDYNAFGYRRGEAQLLADGSRGLEYRRVTELTPHGEIAHQTLWKTDGTGAPAIDYDAEYDSATGLMFFENAQQASAATLRQLRYLHDHYLNLQSQDLTLPKGTGYGTFTETYTYDELARLRGAARSWSDVFNRGNELTVYEYDDLGNITKKDDYASKYTYGDRSRATRLGGPHAVVEISGKKDGSSAQFQYDLNGNLVSGDHRTIAFDYVDRPAAITYDGAVDSFWYGPDGTRFMQRAPGKTVYYLDKDIEYLFYDFGYVQTKLYLSDTVELMLDDSAPSKIAYKVFDRLGSLLATTDGAGTTLPPDAHSFDAFGGPRAADGTPTAGKLHPAGDFGTVTNRGFTEHEHLDDVYLIHMNGRAYDYRLGRFLSVDPIISKPTDAQSLNPYSYIQNNPLSGRDPTGYMSVGEGCGAYSRCDVTLVNPTAASARLYSDSNSSDAVESRAKTSTPTDRDAPSEFAKKFASSADVLRKEDPSLFQGYKQQDFDGFAWKADTEQFEYGYKLMRQDQSAVAPRWGDTVTAMGRTWRFGTDPYLDGRFIALVMFHPDMQHFASQAGTGAGAALFKAGAMGVAGVSRGLRKVNGNDSAARAAGEVHGNSRLSTRAQHGYEIEDTMTGEVVKPGVSGGSRTASGGSYRANRQAAAWNREAGQVGRYVPRVVHEVPAGPGARARILQWENEDAARLRAAGQLRDPTKHSRP